MRKKHAFLTAVLWTISFWLAGTCSWALPVYEINFKTTTQPNDYEQGLIYKDVSERSIQNGILRLCLKEGEEKAKTSVVIPPYSKLRENSPYSWLAPDLYEAITVSMRIKAREPASARNMDVLVVTSQGTNTFSIPLEEVEGKGFHQYTLDLKKEKAWQGKSAPTEISFLLSLGQKKVDGTLIEVETIKFIPAKWKVVEDKLGEAELRLWYYNIAVSNFPQQGIEVKGLKEDVAKFQDMVGQAKSAYEGKEGKEGKGGEEIEKAYNLLLEAEKLQQVFYSHIRTARELVAFQERIHGIKMVMALYQKAGQKCNSIAPIEEKYASLAAVLKEGNFNLASEIKALNEAVDKEYQALDKDSVYHLPMRSGVSETSIARFAWDMPGRGGDLGNQGEGLLINDQANIFVITKGEHAETKIRLTSDAFSDTEEKVVSDEKKDVTWTAYKREARVKGGDGKEYHWDYFCSLLAPGFLLKTDLPTISLEEKRRPKSAPTHLIVPEANGSRVVKLEKGTFTLTMAENWVLLLFQGKKNFSPILLVLEKKPDNFELTDKALKINNSKGVGHIGIVDYAGVMLFDDKEFDKWIEGVPAGVVEKCRRIAQLMSNYPVECKEYYAVDEGKHEIFIRNEIGYYPINDEWGAKKVVYAPVPPLLSFVQDKGYPRKIEGKIVDFDVPTKYGPYRAVEGNVLEYRLPLPDFNHLCYLKTDRDLGVKSPVLNITGMIRAVPGGYMSNIGGVQAQVAAWNVLPKDLQRILLEQSRIFLDYALRSNAGRSTLADTDFGQDGCRSSDLIEPLTGKYYMNWGANCMVRKGQISLADFVNAPSVFIFQPFYYYAKYSGDWQFIRDNWELLKEAFALAGRQDDWALLVVTSENNLAKTNNDGTVDTLKMPVSFMRMAMAMGDRESYMYAAYLGAKHAISVLANHCIGEYMQQYNETALQAPGDYSLDCGVGEYGCEIREYNNYAWQDILGNWEWEDIVQTGGPWQHCLSLRFNMWTGCFASMETYDLYSQLMVDSNRKIVFQSIPQHIPDWYCPPRKHVSSIVKYMLMRNVLGETTGDFAAYFKTAKTDQRDFLVFAALQGRDAPCYPVNWEPNRLVQGTYDMNANKAKIEIEAAQPGVVKLKSMVQPASIRDNDKLTVAGLGEAGKTGSATPSTNWEYNAERKILSVQIEKGKHTLVLDYPGWQIPKRERLFPESAILPSDKKPEPKVSSVKYPGDLGKGLTFYLTFNHTLEAEAFCGSGSPLPFAFPKNARYEKGVKGEAFVVDPKNRLLQYSDRDNLSYQSGTVSFWLKPNYEPAALKDIMKKQDGWSDIRFIISTDDRDGESSQFFVFRLDPEFRFRLFSAYPLGSKLGANPADIGLHKDKWSHVVATWDGDGNSHSNSCLYVDGNLVAKDEKAYTKAPGADEPNSVILIGGGSGARKIEATSDAINGFAIDELRIYNRPLTSEEVAELYKFDQEGVK